MTPPTPSEDRSPGFEEALARLEEILEKMNAGSLTLDESVRLYEEADRLIAVCNAKLTEAEQKVELLVKNRAGELVTGADGKPQTTDFPGAPPGFSSSPEDL